MAAQAGAGKTAFLVQQAAHAVLRGDGRVLPRLEAPAESPAERRERARDHVYCAPVASFADMGEDRISVRFEAIHADGRR